MKRLIFSILIFLMSKATYAKPVFILKGLNQQTVSSKYLQTKINDNFWGDIKVNETTITPLKTANLRFHFKATTLNSVIFEWPDNKIEILNAYILDSKGDTCEKLNYNDVNGFNGKLFLKNQVLILAHPKLSEIYTICYSLKSHNPAYIECWARQLYPFFDRFIKEYSWYGLFAGIIITVFILNILFFISIKEVTYLFYALYTISLGIFNWSYTGLGFQWLWTNSAEWNRYSYMLTSFLLLTFQYFYLYFYTKNLNTVKLKYILLIISLRFGVLIYTFYNLSFTQWHLFLDFITLIIQIWIMFKINLHKSLHGKIYILSIILLSSSYLIFISGYYNWINNSYLTYNSVAIGGILEIILGIWSLVLRYKMLNEEKNILQSKEIESLKSITELKEKVLQESREKERIQLEVNKELEVKIQERTVELAQKNNKLEELNNKLLYMSSQLDKQNWSLNKELTGDRLKLMWGKNISFEDFKLTFPSDKHIYRFIAGLKWQDDKFECKKCKSEKWVEGLQFLSRKCIECKYEESVTANTLFHSLKFPIQKALYISLHTVINRDDLPVKQLAEEIDLREATAWAFRKKTLERITKKGMSRGEILKSLVSE